MISISKAAQTGHTRLRMPHWTNPLDHIEITITGKQPGPWAKLWSPFNKVCNGRDPMMALIGSSLFVTHCIDPNRNSYVPYTGPLPSSAEYKQACESFDEFDEFVHKGEPYVRSQSAG